MQHPQAVYILGCDPATADKILIKNGITIKGGWEFEPPPDNKKIINMECEIEGVIDQTLMRTVAKIAFNYLAYWQKRDFVLHDDFNVIRNFILKGERPPYQVIQVEQNSILGDEPIKGKRRSGHIVTVNWAQDNKSILGQVSLMNWLKYKICLSSNFTGERRDI